MKTFLEMFSFPPPLDLLVLIFDVLLSTEPIFSVNSVKFSTVAGVYKYAQDQSTWKNLPMIVDVDYSCALAK